MKNKKTLIIIGSVLVVIIVAVVLILAISNKGPDSKEKENKKPNANGEIVSDEETVTEEYGFSKEDAIAVAKEIFQSDNYEFDAKVREDNMWVVTVKNTDNDETYTIIVNPNDGTHEFVTE